MSMDKSTDVHMDQGELVVCISGLYLHQYHTSWLSYSMSLNQVVKVLLNSSSGLFSLFLVLCISRLRSPITPLLVKSKEYFPVYSYLIFQRTERFFFFSCLHELLSFSASRNYSSSFPSVFLAIPISLQGVSSSLSIKHQNFSRLGLDTFLITHFT